MRCWTSDARCSPILQTLKEFSSNVNHKPLATVLSSTGKQLVHFNVSEFEVNVSRDSDSPLCQLEAVSIDQNTLR